MLNFVAGYIKALLTVYNILDLASLAVRPGFQGMGIGAALVGMGTDRADGDKKICWLESTPAGYGLYKHFGYKDVGFFELDLARWTGSGFGYGSYRYTFMLRLPEPMARMTRGRITEG